jgi:hypothetical protein
MKVRGRIEGDKDLYFLYNHPIATRYRENTGFLIYALIVASSKYPANWRVGSIRELAS